MGLNGFEEFLCFEMFFEFLICAICVICGWGYLCQFVLFVVRHSLRPHPILLRILFQFLSGFLCGLQAHPALCRPGLWHRYHLNRKAVLHAPLLRFDNLTDILKQHYFPIFRHHGSLWPDSSAPPAYGKLTRKNGNPR